MTQESQTAGPPKTFMISRIQWLICLLLLVWKGGLFGQTAVLAIRSAPERPIIEVRDGNKSLNFELVVKNNGPIVLRISGLQLDIYDSTHKLVLRKSINTDAFAPSIDTIGKRTMAPGEVLDIFNPFFEFGPSVPLDQLQFSFCLLRESNEQEREHNLHRLPDDCDLRQKAVVFPRVYANKTLLTLPLRGKVFIWEGHDFYAHHLRVPLGNQKVHSLGITSNSNNFASDFIYLDKNGMAYHSPQQRLENWYGYGQPVYAPGAGVVMSAANDIPDNWFEDGDATRIGHPKVPADKDPKDIGNFVLIDHQDGEYSLLVHLKPGSVTVRTGNHVVPGQPIGQIGFSGDSIFPHLHYSLMDGPEVFKAWGLPAYFTHFKRHFGATVDVSRGPVNSGDFVESDPSLIQ